MNTFITLLRGINVSGQKLIKMADLKSHFESLGYQEVQTYIQSGNIVFQSKETIVSNLIEQIERKIRKEYKFDVPVIIKSLKDLKFVLENNPFVERGEDTDRVYVTFLDSKPSKAALDSIDSQAYYPEEFICVKDIIFLFSPLGYGKAKINNNFLENKLKVTASSRNWKTVNKLYQMALDLK